MPDSSRSDSHRDVVTSHLRTVEDVLASATADDALVACEAALDHLRQASAAHDRHMREVSHDLRNALTTVTGQAQILERLMARGELPPERIAKALKRITESVAEANAIINRLSE